MIGGRRNAFIDAAPGQADRRSGGWRPACRPIAEFAIARGSMEPR